MTTDRDRVTAILTLAEAAKRRLGFHDVQSEADIAWLARRLLEVLDTIDRARELLSEGETVRALRVLRQALNGGNDATP